MSQLWSCVVFFCEEWRQVSFRGGEGGAGGQSALELGVVVVCFFFGGGAGGQSALELGVVVVCFFWGARGASQLPGCEGGMM